MELQVKEYTTPEKVLFNYEELKAEITEKAERYKNLVVTEDAIPGAKADKANLNKLKKALNDERIRREKEYMAPFNVFKDQIKELCNIIDEPVKSIDSQLKKFEDEEKEKKRVEIEKIYAEIGFPEYAPLDKFFDVKWLNKTTSIKKIKDELIERRGEISKSECIINDLDEFSFEAMEVYKDTLNFSMAIEEGHRLADLQKRKEEAKVNATEDTGVVPTREPEIKAEIKEDAPADKLFAEKESDAQWVGFEALLTPSNAQRLRAFFDENEIEFRRPQK